MDMKGLIRAVIAALTIAAPAGAQQMHQVGLGKTAQTPKTRRQLNRINTSMRWDSMDNPLYALEEGSLRLTCG